MDALVGLDCRGGEQKQCCDQQRSRSEPLEIDDRGDDGFRSLA
jgi:hypothetical protein